MVNYGKNFKKQLRILTIELGIPKLANILPLTHRAIRIRKVTEDGRSLCTSLSFK